MNDIEKRIEELTDELNYHNHKYYVDDAPEISDFAFDKMLVELEQLEEKYPEYKKKNSPTVRVGGEAVKSFGEVHHDVPMLSQQKAFSKEDATELLITWLMPHQQIRPDTANSTASTLLRGLPRRLALTQS